jgi:radical SAM superfamily enzyme YgiQ (UPF0313 family)
MRFCLVAPPTLYEIQSRQLSAVRAARLIGENPPLGILTLAAILESAGVEAVVLDLNREMSRFLSREGHCGDFVSFTASTLSVADCDIYGFGSISASYPVTLRVIRALKRELPGRTIIVGGPQASVCDRATLDAFQEIDVVVRGEADQIILNLVAALSHGSGLENVAGITLRREGVAVRTPEAPLLRDLDGLPAPAYHLHPEIAQARFAALELGRGCPFGCKFCATNDLFRRRYRLKSAQAVLEQMHRMNQHYGIREFDLVHDMFTVDRKRVEAFCHELKDAASSYRWFCSARTDFVDEELLRLMSEAGCASVFYGVETGSPRMQRIIDKNLDLAEAERAVALADRYGMYAAVSLIVGFPEETRDDIRETANLFVRSTRVPRALPLIYLLVPLGGTPVHCRYRGELSFDAAKTLIFDQNWDAEPADRELIARHPDLFSCFYELPLEYDRTVLNELHFFLRNGCKRFKWLMIALLDETGDILSVFEGWLDWRHRERSLLFADERDIASYYESLAFFFDLLDYLERVYLPGASGGSIAVRSMTQYSRDLLSGRSGCCAWAGAKTPDEFTTAAPLLSSEVVVFDSEVDGRAVIEALSGRRKPAPFAYRRRQFAAAYFEREPAQLIELTPLAAALLARCNGESTVSEIIRALRTGSEPVRPGIPECVETLFALQERGLINFKAAAPGEQANRTEISHSPPQERRPGC